MRSVNNADKSKLETVGTTAGVIYAQVLSRKIAEILETNADEILTAIEQHHAIAFMGTIQPHFRVLVTGKNLPTEGQTKCEQTHQSSSEQSRSSDSNQARKEQS